MKLAPADPSLRQRETHDDLAVPVDVTGWHEPEPLIEAGWAAGLRDVAGQRKRADTWLMWGAARIIMQGWCSDDGFFYFQPWLVGLGRDAFARLPRLTALLG